MGHDSSHNTALARSLFNHMLGHFQGLGPTLSQKNILSPWVFFPAECGLNLILRHAGLNSRDLNSTLRHAYLVSTFHPTVCCAAGSFPRETAVLQ